jgi:putative hemolysin
MLFVAFGLLFLITALLSMAEMATFSARPDRMRQRAEVGDRRGRLVLVYQRSPVSFLAAGQVVATAASFAIGAIMQAQVVPDLSGWIGGFLSLTQTQLDWAAALIALTLFTLLALILTNVVPKQIGFDHADGVAMFFAKPFRLLINLTRPIAWIVTVASQAFEKAINRKVGRKVRVTEADLLTLVAEGIRIGSLDERETAFIKNALRLSELTIERVMTPVKEVEAIDAEWPTAKIDGAVRSSRHSYLPVYDRTIDRTVGILRARDWLSHSGQPTDVRRALDPAPVISAADSAVSLFDVLKNIDARMVIVQGIGGETVGIVTLNDAVRLVAGELRSLDA